jgi:hypothetical protein
MQTTAEILNLNPTLFEPREASESYSRGQWDNALKATPHSPKGDVSYVGPYRQLRARVPTRRPRSLLTVLNYCRISLS